VTAVVGGVGLTVGAIFGLEAMSKKSGADCDEELRCPSPEAVTKLQGAQTDGNLSTVFFVVGGVLAASGVTLWALAPRSVQVAPSVGNSAAGIVLRGAW
jgi:hypothetical protein